MNTPSFPIAQPYPVPGSFPGPSIHNNLRSQVSVATLADGRRIGNGPGSALAASQSNLTLNTWHNGQPQLRSNSPHLPTPNASGLWSSHTPLPSSLLNSGPIPRPSKTEKRGFFSKLFGFCKPKSKQPTTQRPTTRLRKSAAPNPMVTTPTVHTRPLSTISVYSSSSSSTQRRRAVLVKRPPTIYRRTHSRNSSTLTRPGEPSLDQDPTHTMYNSGLQPTPAYLQMGGSMLSLIPEHTTIASVSNHAHSFNSPNYTISDRATTVAAPVNSVHLPLGNVNQPYGNNQVQGPATTNYLHHPGTSDQHSRSPSYPNGNYTGAQNPGYQPLIPVTDVALCTVCKENPQYAKLTTGEVSPYCSEICQAADTTASSQTQQAPVTCSYPGCTQPAKMYPTDHYWNYCSELHERHARKGCISCRKADDSGTQLCKRCKEIHKQRAPSIIPVPMDHDTFWHVVDKFSESWPNPTQCPIFQAARIYKIVLTEHRRDMYLGYRDTLEFYGRFTMKGKPEGNERVLWHGSRRSCNLGEKGQSSPCMIPRCSLCSIIRGPSDKGSGPVDVPPGRFGMGIYAFTKASKAIDHSSNDKNVETSWVALLLSKVATGHECVMRHDNTTLTGPPQGYDSVIGEVRGRLNYDELVVYTNDAIRPTWLILYQRT